MLTVVLLVVQLAATLTPKESTWIDDAQLAIWALFLVEFIAELLLACDKPKYLRDHWLIGLAVILPALRVVRVLRIVLLLRHVNLLWLVLRTNRAIQALRRIVPGRETAYLVLLTALVVAVGTAGAYHFEQGQQGSQIQTLGDALWWAACLVTTINNGLDPVSPEARIIAILMRIYAVAVFGLIAGNLASVLLLHRQQQAAQANETRHRRSAA